MKATKALLLPSVNLSTQFPLLLESLELRIAPAGLSGIDYKAITLGSPQLLKAGQGLSTADGAGSYILAVEKGQALIFTTDLNGNNQFDPNEITGIAAGDGLRLTSFVDINGDIVTNLQADGNLSDSDGDATNGRDGLILLNSKIEGITLRSVTTADIKAGDFVSNRIILSSYSIHGNIYAGGGVGVVGAGIVIDTVGLADQVAKFNGTSLDYQVASIIPSLGTIKTGTAAGGQYFNFGYKTTGAAIGSLQLGGTLKAFIPGIGQAGGDIIGLKVGDNAAAPSANADGTGTFASKPFYIDAIVAGNGGIGAKGGDIKDIYLHGDTGGLRIQAGNGGDGVTGGAGGSVLNLNSEDALNGVVQIRTGNGGQGFLGNAGSAGTLSFGKFNMNGNISIGLGNGGTALVNAGAGTSLPTADLQPSGNGNIASAVAVLSTYRDIGDIGTAKPIDFNNDGYTDIVYLTNTPDQIAIKFGRVDGIDNSTPTLYFASPGYTSLETASSAVIVADFNGDGFLDIATGSSEANSTDGIRVFLNPGGIGTENGWLQVAQQSNGGNYVDFSIHNALPSLGPVSQLRSGAAVTDLAAGDFNGDGIMDLAVVTQNFIYQQGVEAVTNILMLTGTGDGRFFANFGYDSSTNSQTLMPLLNKTYFAKNHGEIVIKATTADTSLAVSPANPEILVAIESGNSLKKSVHTIQYFAPASMAYLSELQTVASAIPTYDVPEIDNGIIVNYDNKDGVPLDIAITDVGGDGVFDVVVLDDAQAVTVLGGTSAAAFASNQGIVLVGDQTLLDDAHVDFKAITAGTFDSLSSDAQFALYTIGPIDAGTDTGFYQFNLPALTAHLDTLTKGDFINAPHPTKDENLNTDIIAFDIFKAQTSDAAFGYVSAMPTTKEPGLFSGVGNLSGNVLFSLNRDQMTIVAGNGGHSILGSGGRGGSIGSGVVSDEGSVITSPFSVTLPSNVALQPNITLVSGTGGSGYINGGAGGALKGIAVSYAPGTSVLSSIVGLVAGAGGEGLTKVGGAGGSLSNFFVETGYYFKAGNGGFGYFGGQGGNIEGDNGLDGFTVSTYSGSVSAAAGTGGAGIAGGGNGGGVNGFSTLFLKILGGVGGSLFYYGGDGGSALAGKGGSGGSIINSSPASSLNNLTGPIRLDAGEGGKGLSGGAGGNITNFQNFSTISTPALVLSALAGNGGQGISGNGGNGGLVSNLIASATGNGAGVQFNRVLAGDGGDSFGAKGGTGGFLSIITTTANSSSTALAAGKGGAGLTRGGDGGSISKTSADAASAANAKVIVIAGAGGDAYAALSTASNVGNVGDVSAILNLRAFGGVNGVGGNGGSIVGFTQPKTVDCSVDLIAGNGGSTINYGLPSASSGAGRGGSISNVSLAGDAGRIDSTVAIKSYADNFVQDILRDGASTQLTDALGNVGVVVGASGRVKGDLPSGDASAKTGSVSNFTASNIMSMVAGSVDRIAVINTISGIKLTEAGGVFGAYKTVPIGPSATHSATLPVYYSGPNQSGVEVATAQIGGSLADGAVVVQHDKSGLLSPRLFTL